MDAQQVAELLSRTPLEVLGVVLPSLMVAAVVIGFVARRWADRRLPPSKSTEDDGLEGSMTAAVLGMLALMMGFTFALAIDRYEARRVLVLEEANAIGTIYLRAQLLDEPHRTRISRLLVDYTDNRLALAKATPDGVPPLLRINDRMVTDLWVATVGAVPTIRDPGLSNAFISGMNLVIDMDSARKAARQARVPVQVFAVLFVYLVVTSGVLGYVFAGQRGRVVAGFWLVLLMLFLLLVFDIDRPNTGRIREGQGSMEQLRDSLAAQPPAVFDRYRPAP